MKQHIVQNSDFDDIVAGKGKGLIGLLSGPPSSGKTLTVEAVADFNRVPLYMVSAGELGTEPDSLEYTLSKVFRLAELWRAVVLLDEANVFL